MSWFESESIECPHCRERLDITDLAHSYAGRDNVKFKCFKCEKSIICNFERDGCPWNTRKGE